MARPVFLTLIALREDLGRPLGVYEVSAAFDEYFPDTIAKLEAFLADINGNEAVKALNVKLQEMQNENTQLMRALAEVNRLLKQGVEVEQARFVHVADEVAGCRTILLQCSTAVHEALAGLGERSHHLDSLSDELTQIANFYEALIDTLKDPVPLSLSEKAMIQREANKRLENIVIMQATLESYQRGVVSALQMRGLLAIDSVDSLRLALSDLVARGAPPSLFRVLNDEELAEVVRRRNEGSLPAGTRVRAGIRIAAIKDRSLVLSGRATTTTWGKNIFKFLAEQRPANVVTDEELLYLINKVPTSFVFGESDRYNPYLLYKLAQIVDLKIERTMGQGAWMIAYPQIVSRIGKIVEVALARVDLQLAEGNVYYSPRDFTKDYWSLPLTKRFLERARQANSGIPMSPVSEYGGPPALSSSWRDE